MILTFILFISPIFALVAPPRFRPAINPQFVDELRSSKILWDIQDPSTNIFRDISMSDLRTRFQPKINKTTRNLQQNFDFIKRTDANQLSLPKNYDPRPILNRCINNIINQGNCSSCWAIVISNLVSDRLCLKNINVSLSAQDILECDLKNKGCTGGYASKGYNFMIDYGIVESKCKPYIMNSTECRPIILNCPRYKCKENSIWFSDDSEETKQHIFENGPVGGVFDVYEDFLSYAGGIYYHTKGEYIGAHAVEVVGWGFDEQSQKEFWICKNSWGPNWGLNGYFMIEIGDCEINDWMSSCEPKIW